MGIMAKAKGESNFTPVSEGLHPAICSAVVDLGMQPGSVMYPDPKRQVYLRFDCVDEMVDFDRDGVKVTGPARCGATFTLSLGLKSNLRRVLESWRGKQFTEQELEGFDVSKLLGVPCQVQVMHTAKGGNVYANIKNIVTFPKGLPRPSAPLDAVIYSPSEPNPKEFEKLPEWLRKKVQERLGDTEEDIKKPKPKAREPGSDDEGYDDLDF